MYLEHFQLENRPFLNVPSGLSFFASRVHQRVLSGLVADIDSGSTPILLVGEVGTGKTTLCFRVRERVRCTWCYLADPFLREAEFLEAVARGLGVDSAAGSRSKLMDAIHQRLLWLHQRGEPALLVVDEAHRLGLPVLDQLHALANMQIDQAHLVNMLLVGQPEVTEVLAHPRLRSLAQRIASRYTLEGMSRADTAHYVRHRIKAAGGRQPELFTRPALGAVWRSTRGVPRLVNLVCDQALKIACERRRGRVRRGEVREAAAVQRPPTRATSGWRPAIGLALAISIAALMALATWGWRHHVGVFPRWRRGGPGEERLVAGRSLAEVLGIQRESPSRGPKTTNASRRAPSSLLPPREAMEIGSESVPAPVFSGAEELQQTEAAAETAVSWEEITLSHPGVDAGIGLVGYPTAGNLETVASKDGTPGPADAVRQTGKELRPEKGAAEGSEGERATASALVPAAGLTLSAIAWDEDPASRLAVINSEVVREGDRLGPWWVQTIAPDHVVLHGAAGKAMVRIGQE